MGDFKYIAEFTTSVQCTEDHWRMRTYTKKCTDETTISDIQKWVQNHEANRRGGVHEVTIRIVE